MVAGPGSIRDDDRAVELVEPREGCAVEVGEAFVPEGGAARAPVVKSQEYVVTGPAVGHREIGA